MKLEQAKRIAVLLAVVCALGLLWPTVAAARQNTHQFNQTWLILGPYYGKEGFTGSNPGTTQLRADYLTDGVNTQDSVIPTTGMVINTNYALSQCASYSFVWRLIRNGFDVPTVIPFTIPAPDGDIVDYKVDVWNTNNGKLDNDMAYAWAFANNLTGSTYQRWVGVDSDDAIQVTVNNIEIINQNVARGWSGTFGNVANTGSVNLLPGLNLVRVKVWNGGGGWGFRCRIQNSGTTGANQGRGTTPANVVWQTDKGSYTIPPLPIPAGIATATRRVRALLNYVPGVPLRVEVTVTTTSGHPDNVRLREWPPQGWTIGTPIVTLGSATVQTTTTARGSTQLIAWDLGPMATTSTALLSYWVTPPGGANTDAVCTGTVTTNAQRLVGRDSYLFAPTQNHTGGAGLFEWYGDIGDPFMGLRLTSQSAPSLIPVWFGPDAIILGNGVNTGRSSFDGTNYSITGAGTDIWNDRDHCRIAVKRMTGDFILRGDIMWTSVSQQNWCKAALIIGDNISPGATRMYSGLRNYYQPNWTDYTGNRFARTQRPYMTQWRDGHWTNAAEAGGQIAITTSTNPAQSPNLSIVPSSLMLVKRGNIIDSFGLYQGIWVRHGATPRTLSNLTSDTVVAGLLCGSVNRWTSATAQFSNVSLSPLPLVSATRSLWDAGGAPTAIFSTQPITVKIFLKNGGGSTALTVRELAPLGWTITGSTPTGLVDEASTITWSLGAFAADTTLTYTMTPPGPIIPITPQFFRAGVCNDQTNVISGYPIGGPNVLQRYLVTTFQQGRFPTSSYRGTLDAHPIMYGAGYANGNGMMNNGWNGEIETGDWNSGTGDNKIAVIKFDVGNISPAATVFAAKLMLYQTQVRRGITSGPLPGLKAVRVFASRMNRPWGEGCSQSGIDGRPVNLGEICWNWAKGFQSPWGSVGIRGGALDSELPESSADVSTWTLVNRWVEWDVTRMASDWVHSPSSNQGIKLSPEDGNTTHYPYPIGYQQGVVTFAARNNGTSANRPILAMMAYVPLTLSATHWELYR